MVSHREPKEYGIQEKGKLQINSLLKKSNNKLKFKILMK